MKRIVPNRRAHSGTRTGPRFTCIQSPKLIALTMELQKPIQTVIALAGKSGDVSHIQVAAQTASAAKPILSTMISNPYKDPEDGPSRELSSNKVLASDTNPADTEDRTSTDDRVRRRSFIVRVHDRTRQSCTVMTASRMRPRI